MNAQERFPPYGKSDFLPSALYLLLPSNFRPSNFRPPPSILRPCFMNTPAHVLISLLCLGRRDTASVLTPAIAGALLPDAPIFLFYFVEKVILGTPESFIWRQAYYQAGWQNFIDLFNSLPLMAIGLGAVLWAGSRVGVLLFGSMMLHVLGDLPLHHDDGHRHFFPFSNWRFESPVSYWDPNHYGGIVTVLEIVLVLVSCGILFRIYQSRAGKIAIGAIGLCYLTYFLYAIAVWL